MQQEPGSLLCFPVCTERPNEREGVSGVSATPDRAILNSQSHEYLSRLAPAVGTVEEMTQI